MHVMSVEGLTKAYEGRTVLDGLRFGITTADRIGVVGANGAGKSTLLRILAGVEEPDAGRITKSADATVVYLPQEASLDPSSTPIEAVAAAAGEHHRHDATHADWDARPAAAAMLDRLGVRDVSTPVGNLSGGLRRRVALAGALVGESDLLILDEPTNHLDADAVEWLEGELQRRRGGLLLVTHDRYFLERLCRRMFELDGGTLYRHEGRYSDVLEARVARVELAGKAEARRRNLLRKEIAWLRRGAQARTSKPRFRVEQAETLMAATPDAGRGQLQLGTGRRRLGNDVFELTAVSKSYGDRIVLRDVDLLVGPGDRVGIVGPNGAGKTTLLDILAGGLVPDSGEVRVGRTVESGYYTQDVTVARGDETAISIVRDVAEWVPLADGRRISASALMERFLFDDSMQHRVTSTLSGGELRRLALCRVLMAAPNVLILDEPTNDLDLDTLAALEDHLDGFAGTIVVASHDRYLLDRLVDTLYGIGPDGTVTKYPGEWAAYRQMRASVEKRPAKAAVVPARSRAATKPSYKVVREHADLEARLPVLEARRAELLAGIEAAASDHEQLLELTAALDAAQADLDAAETRWLELADLVGE